MEEKTCSHCHETKPISEFGKRHNRPSLHKYCRTCDAARAREYHHANREKVLPPKRDRYWRDRDKSLEYKRVYGALNVAEIRNIAIRRAKEPKGRARAALRSAVKSGSVIRPECCEECRLIPPKGKLHGHHEDYSKPLEVIWLCWKCHGKAHRAALASTSAPEGTV